MIVRLTPPGAAWRTHDARPLAHQLQYPCAEWAVSRRHGRYGPREAAVTPRVVPSLVRNERARRVAAGRLLVRPRKARPNVVRILAPLSRFAHCESDGVELSVLGT